MMIDVAKVTTLDDHDGVAKFFKGVFVKKGTSTGGRRR
jgi:hypothetical protein